MVGVEDRREAGEDGALADPGWLTSAPQPLPKRSVGIGIGIGIGIGLSPGFMRSSSIIFAAVVSHVAFSGQKIHEKTVPSPSSA